MPSVTCKSFLLSVIMLNVVMLNVIVLNVVAPYLVPGAMTFSITTLSIMVDLQCLKKKIMLYRDLVAPLYRDVECRYTESSILMMSML